MKPLLCCLFIVLVLAAGFSYPAATLDQTKKAAPAVKHKSLCAMETHSCKHAPCDHNKKDKSGTTCYFCILCVAFVVPFKPGFQRNFATGKVNYARLLQSKLTDYSSSQWRPPNA